MHDRVPEILNLVPQTPADGPTAIVTCDGHGLLVGTAAAWRFAASVGDGVERTEGSGEADTVGSGVAEGESEGSGSGDVDTVGSGAAEGESEGEGEPEDVGQGSARPTPG